MQSSAHLSSRDLSADLADWTGPQLLEGYARKTLSPVDVTKAVIAHIEAREPPLRALYAFDPEAALNAAKESEQRWMRGEARALDGIPATIKENIATKGTPVPLGTAARPLIPAAEDAPAAARLREDGVVILAKTTMPDYGMLSSGLSSFHPLTRNPWDLTKNPGGSSAGAGAAAAAGYGPFHIGTDIGGSIRLPASWCGVFGLKPSFGRIPIDPTYYGRVAGPMTRTVRDAALMMTSLTRPDVRDPMSLPYQDLPWLDLNLDIKGLRIGVMMEAGIGLPLDPEIRATVERAAQLLSQAGAVIEEVPAFITREMLDGLDDFWRQRAWADMAPLSEAERAKILPYIRQWAEGGKDLTGAEVYSGMNQMMVMRHAAVAATHRFDFVISPVAPCVAYPAELASPIHNPEEPFEHIGYTVAFNMSDQPASSVNAGFTRAGLPIGLQIIGRRFDDVGVLRLSQAWEEMCPEKRPWPKV
ncbi:aspartyl-tRNA(Asn)/glutamyl-tRNA(Gln) amidotransferase subunit A [Microvirga lupini]|uniref:Aspartyl-tRNA(Asn)/glutamyl-tRNA(Gln) amidotransferase subunit A n=1 Tax=Microvirga lupini TaxID=420324 RepID=A0A7W4VJQ6_9HYPH|nr:amidase [Microvirga lupini]MBB3018448.1 aspartyl-tRNA(Asn)/glutamyl-tRNA(Gln) amidotransferase subunit A [Microvirga lupini]